jgi:tetratricopeptide (TPR) repeat protein
LLLPVSKLTAVAQLLEGRRSVGSGDLATATRVATALAAAYADTPNAQVIRAVKAHVYTLLDLLKHAQMSADTKTRLQAITSDAMALAGYADMNAGRLAEADAWFADALKLARQVGDRRLEALALVGCAWIPYYQPVPDRAKVVEALEAAAAFQRFLPPAARAYVFGSLSRERAELGDDLVSGRFLDHAHAAAAFIPHDEPGWGWWSTHGELAGWDAGPRSKVYAGSRYLGLGRPAEALKLFDEALNGTVLPVRRSHLHKWTMDACVALDDPERACVSGVAALDEAKTHGVGIIPPKIRKARQAFPKPWGTLKPVTELDERLTLTR